MRHYPHCKCWILLEATGNFGFKDTKVKFALLWYDYSLGLFKEPKWLFSYSVCMSYQLKPPFIPCLLALAWQTMLAGRRQSYGNYPHWNVVWLVCNIQYVVACQAHPALVKQVQCRSVFLNFKQSVIRLILGILRALHKRLVKHYSSPPTNGLKGPWSVSHRCLKPRWFVGDPTLLARYNIQVTAMKQQIWYH